MYISVNFVTDQATVVRVGAMGRGWAGGGREGGREGNKAL